MARNILIDYYNDCLRGDRGLDDMGNKTCPSLERPSGVWGLQQVEGQSLPELSGSCPMEGGQNMKRKKYQEDLLLGIFSFEETGG